MIQHILGSSCMLQTVMYVDDAANVKVVLVCERMFSYYSVLFSLTLLVACSCVDVSKFSRRRLP